MISPRPEQISVTRAAGRAVSIRVVVGRRNGDRLLQLAFVCPATGSTVASMVFEAEAAKHMADGLARAIAMLDEPRGGDEEPADMAAPRAPQAVAESARAHRRGRKRPTRVRGSTIHTASNGGKNP